MAAPTSKIDVCNIAADAVGTPLISSIDPPTTPTEIIFARHYDASRQQVLRKGVWNFAVQRAKITRIGTPPFEFTDQYQFPADWVRFLEIYSDTSSAVITPAAFLATGRIFDIQGRTYLTNAGGAASLNMKYIADVTDVNQWDDLFINLVALTLAMKVCYPITKSRELLKTISDLLTIEWSEAMSIDGQESPPVRTQNSKALSLRQRLSGGSVASPWTYIR